MVLATANVPVRDVGAVTHRPGFETTIDRDVTIINKPHM